MVFLNKSLELQVAKVASLDPEMDAVARKVESYIVGGAPVEYGDFVESIQKTTVRTKGGVRDRVIYSDDDGALSIEFGYMAKNGRWIPGHYAFSRAVMAMKFGG